MPRGGGQDTPLFPVPYTHCIFGIKANRHQPLNEKGRQTSCYNKSRINPRAVIDWPGLTSPRIKADQHFDKSTAVISNKSFMLTWPSASKAKQATPCVCASLRMDTVISVYESHTQMYGSFPTWPVATWILSGCRARLWMKEGVKRVHTFSVRTFRVWLWGPFKKICSNKKCWLHFLHSGSALWQ